MNANERQDMPTKRIRISLLWLSVDLMKKEQPATLDHSRLVLFSALWPPF